MWLCASLSKTVRTSRGITLVELVVSIGIITIIGLGIVAFQRSVISNTKVLQSSFSAQQQIRKTLQSFVSELRAAAPSALGTYALESVATSSIVFYSNADNDASVERIRYFFATTTVNGEYNALKKGVIKPVGTVYNSANEIITTVVRDVRNSSTTPIFSYYDATYNGTASSTAPLAWPVSIPAIRLVKINIAVDPNIARSPVFQFYSTQVSIRNLKDNL